MNADNTFEVVKKLQDGSDFFVAIVDGDTGTIVIKAWTTQPENWLSWANKVRAEYLRLVRRGVNPNSAARAARMSVMAAGPSTTRFIERVESVRFPPLQ